MGGTLREGWEKSEGRSPGPLWPGSLLSSQAGSLTSKAPSRPRGSWGHRREAGEIRRGRREGPSRRSRRGAEGNRLAHSGTGGLLSSQASPLPSKAPPSPTPNPPHWSWGHRREAREIRRGRREGPSQTPDLRTRRGEEAVCPAHSSPGSLLGSQVRSPAL